MLIRWWYFCCALTICVVTSFPPAAVPASAQTSLQVHFLNAGNGDAAWFTMPDGSTALIDCGPPEFSTELLLQLQTAGIATINLLAPSRSTPDVLGGCPDVVRFLNVQSVLWSPTTSNSAAKSFDALLNSSGVNRLPAFAGWTQDYGGATLTLLNPPQIPSGNAADDSQVLLLEYSSSAVLFSGAIHQTGEAQVKAAGGYGRRVTVLRAADHGVSGTSSTEFLTSLFPLSGPKVVILSYSAARAASHPDADVAQRLANSSNTLLSTATNGSITVTIGADGTALPSSEH
jgi:competence protein ComEC